MTDKKRVLVKEKLAPEGVEYLRSEGFEVDLGVDWSPEEFMAKVGDYDALIIRSATKVTAEVIEAGQEPEGRGPRRRRRGQRRRRRGDQARHHRRQRAGEQRALGGRAHDRHDDGLRAQHPAGAHGPQGRTLGPLQVRRRRDRGKTLGIIGLGRIGFLVAERARGLKMRVLAYDPYVPAERFHELGLERADKVDAIYREADFITVHLPKNAETLGFVDDEAFAKMKDGVRVINVARGGIIDEEALARAIESGKVAAAAVDVYPSEPTTDDILFKYDQVVSTPHLGASTKEAQLRAGTQVAEQVALALKGQFAPNAVNVPLVVGEEADELMPYLEVCKILGKVLVQLADGPVDACEVTYEGVIGRYDTRILTLSVMQGMLADKVEGEVNFVNVPHIAEERGISVKEVKQPAAVDFLNLITVTTRTEGGKLAVAGTTLGPRHQPRIVTVYGQDIDIEPVEHMVFVRAKAQVPGTFGKIGGKMGEFGINISQVSVGRAKKGQPEMMGLAIDAPIGDEQLAQVVSAAGLTDAKLVNL